MNFFKEQTKMTICLEMLGMTYCFGLDKGENLRVV